MPLALNRIAYRTEALTYYVSLSYHTYRSSTCLLVESLLQLCTIHGRTGRNSYIDLDVFLPVDLYT